MTRNRIQTENEEVDKDKNKTNKKKTPKNRSSWIVFFNFLVTSVIVCLIINLYPAEIVLLTVNPLPDDKILDRCKLKPIEDDILKCIQNEKISAIYGRKHCEKRRNCLLQAISPFPHDVFHSYISLVRQIVALFSNGLNRFSYITLYRVSLIKLDD